MPPDLGQYETGENFEPSKATLCAWEAQAHMLEFAQCEPGSVQAEVAHEQANRDFNDVVTLTWDYLRASAYKRSGGNVYEVDEILQETYLRAYKYLPKFHGNANVETWLTQIMFNRLSTFYKKKSRDESFRVEQPDDGYDLLGQLAIDSALEPENQNQRGEEIDQLVEMLSELSPRRRKAVVLAYYYNHSHEEIARILGCSVSSAKMLVFRGKQAFRENHPEAKPDAQEHS